MAVQPRVVVRMDAAEPRQLERADVGDLRQLFEELLLGGGVPSSVRGRGGIGTDDESGERGTGGTA